MELQQELDAVRKELKLTQDRNELLDKQLNEAINKLSVDVCKKIYDGKMVYRPMNRLALMLSKMSGGNNLSTKELKLLISGGLEINITYPTDDELFTHLHKGTY